MLRPEVAAEATAEVVAPAEVLVVGSHRGLAALVRRALQGGPYRISAAEDAGSAVDALFAARPDLVVLLEGGGGEAVALCRELHAVDELPAIILAEDSDTMGRVRGLTCADDYVVLPVAPAELAARVGAVLRRARPCRDPAPPVFDDGRLRVDLRRRVVASAGRVLELTPTEFRLLAILVRGLGRVFTHDQLLSRVWGTAYAGDSHLLRLHIANLRRKLGNPPHIRTHRGVGYAFLPPPTGHP